MCTCVRTRRVRYDQTLGELRAAAARALGLEPAELSLWRHGAELVPGTEDAKWVVVGRLCGHWLGLGFRV